MRKLLVFGFLLAGCSGASKTTSTNPPPSQNATVSGQYNIVTTSTKGAGTINIYTNFSMSGATFTGMSNTLVCPGNTFINCQGNDAPFISITPSGTVSGNNIQILLTWPSNLGNDTITFVGTANGTTLSGTYSDTFNDTGNWSASVASSFTGQYSGSFNSTQNPLTIAPTFSAQLTQDGNFNLTGSATIMNSPCVTSFNFSSGQAIGGAFSLSDSSKNLLITGLPNGSSFIFTYSIGATGSCSADSGRGTVTKN